MTKPSRTATTGRTAYRCVECGWQSAKWVGRCGECQAWGTVEEVGLPGASPLRGRGLGADTIRAGLVSAGPVSAPARPIADVDAAAAHARPSGVGELDRVLGGGLVPGGVVLLAGEPGVGKSTLLLEVAAGFARDGARALYVSGEESAAQMRLRAGRIHALHPELFVAPETDLAAIVGHIDAVQPELLVVDSVQTVACAEVEGAAGGVTQIRAVTAGLTRVAKDRGLATVLVGHVTKEGSIAGPRLLEHLVDVVLHFEGDRHSRLRMVRAVKNRYGPSDEIGCFDFSDRGIVGLPDPSGLFLSRGELAVPGQCVTVTVEGRRPLVAEVQALVAPSSGPPRRATAGLEPSRVAMTLAVLERRARIPLGNRDVYAATVGGVRLSEPAADLATALAVASASADAPLPGRLVAIGEVGLAGEVRPVTGIHHRLAEAARLGFTHALVPPDPGPVPPGIDVTQTPDLTTALAVLRSPASLAAQRRPRLQVVTGGGAS